MPEQPHPTYPPTVYAPFARRAHWWTAAFVAVLFPVGLTMTYRGGTLDIWDNTTNTLYSLHKLLGFTLLLIVVVRLAFRLIHGAPPDEPTIEPWQRLASHVTHRLLYGLLLVVPLLGWIGVQLLPALELFDAFSLPAFLAPDEAAAKRVFGLHKIAAFALAAVASLHIAAALWHYFVRKDGVLARMLPAARRQ